MQVTAWMPVSTPPVRAGEYEVKFTWPTRPVLRLKWDGERWSRIGKFKPTAAWGDVWRGVTE